MTNTRKQSVRKKAKDWTPFVGIGLAIASLAVACSQRWFPNPAKARLLHRIEYDFVEVDRTPRFVMRLWIRNESTEAAKSLQIVSECEGWNVRCDKHTIVGIQRDHGHCVISLAALGANKEIHVELAIPFEELSEELPAIHDVNSESGSSNCIGIKTDIPLRKITPMLRSLLASAQKNSDTILER